MRICFVFLLLFSLLISPTSELSASHNMGGEITWECDISGDSTIFELTLYRNCSSHIGSSPYEAINIYGHSTLNFIAVNLVSVSDISESCNSAGPSINCGAGPPFNNPNAGLGASEKRVYRSNPISLGIPSNSRFILSWELCCRVLNMDNINGSGSTPFFIRSIMYAPVSTLGTPIPGCHDNSPKFLEKPVIATQAGIFSYESLVAMDKDVDSLYYFMAPTLQSFTGTNVGSYQEGIDPPYISYVSGYSPLSPFPGSQINPQNIASQIDRKTGVLTYLSNEAGIYAYDIGVEAYRGNELTAVVCRTFHRYITANTTANFSPSIQLTNIASSVPISQIGNHSEVTVLPGSNLEFNLSSFDFDFLLNSFSPQSIQLSAKGSNFSSPLGSTNSNCLLPPCASLTPTLPQTSFLNPASNSSDFLWQIDFTHLTGSQVNGVYSNIYNYSFTFTDDFCPIPARKVTSLAIKVKLVPTGPPRLDSIGILANNALVLNYTPPASSGDLFEFFLIYYKSSDSSSNGFNVIDTVFSLTDRVAILPILPNGIGGKFYMQSDNSYGLSGMPSDTILYLESIGTPDYVMRSLTVSMEEAGWIIKGLAQGKNDIEIFSLDGRTVHSVKAFEGGEFSWKPSISLSKGMYLISIQGEQSIGQLKVLKP